MNQPLKYLLLLTFAFAIRIDVFGQMDNPANWFYVGLQAHVSSTGCGSDAGEVQLMYTDVQRNIVNEKPVNPYATGTSEYTDWQAGYDAGFGDAGNNLEYGTNRLAGDYNASFYDGYDSGFSWYGRYGGEDLNTSNPTPFGSTAYARGYALIHMAGVDSLQNMISTYAYFFGKARENAGWYFTGWSFTEGGSDLGGKVGENDSLLFKIYPGALSGLENITTQHVYATFKPLLVADYTVDGLINVGSSAGSSGFTTVRFDVQGDRADVEDFTISIAESNYTASIVSCENNVLTARVDFVNPGGPADSTYRGNVTLYSKSGCSQLTAPIYARVGSLSATEAGLYDGKTLRQTGDLTELLPLTATCEEPIVRLNRDYEFDLTVSDTLTLDLNGYRMTGSLTIGDGEVTLAYSKYGGRILKTIRVQAGKLILNGTTIVTSTGVIVNSGAALMQNGATIEATECAIENRGNAVVADGQMSGTIGIENYAGEMLITGGTISGETGISVRGGAVTVQRAMINGTVRGVCVHDGSFATEQLATIVGGEYAVMAESGTTILHNGKFDAPIPLSGNLTLEAGYFKIRSIGVAISAEQKVFNVLAGTEYNAGYRYFVGNETSARQSGVGVCKIGTTAYATLEDALAYANNNVNEEVVIVMLNDYVLPAGYYTLPAKATLIVPMSDTQETGYPIINRVSNNSSHEEPYIQPYAFRRLTFASGVTINVHGTIELSGTQRASDDAYAAMPQGAYGHLVMAAGSKMILQNQSELRAWGFMTGLGETEARRGSVVREQFQMGDWKGGGFSLNMLNDTARRVFPITQYFIQNIESPVTYHPGSVLSTTTSVSAVYGGIGITAMASDIKVIGVAGRDEAMFLMDNNADADNTWVRKWYDAARDVQTYDVNSAAHIGSMVLDLGKLGSMPLVMNSGAFVLPITNNMKIHLLSGYMDFTQSTALLAGAEVEVDKEARISISKNTNPQVISGSLFVYDGAQWDTYACGKDGNGYESGKYTKVVKYSPSWEGAPTLRSEVMQPNSASINVHGTFDTDAGYIFTTASGANIFSTNEDAGTFTFTSAASTSTKMVYQVREGNAYKGEPAVSAMLKNGERVSPEYATTAGTEAGKSYCYLNDRWTLMTMDEDDECFMVDNYGQYYAKPADYVAIDAHNDNGEIIGNNDHTYSDLSGAGRLFILLRDDCQWWEVENVDNLYHCVHPDNNTYYYWGMDYTTYEEGWLEKLYTITWKNWDGTELQSFDHQFSPPMPIEYKVPYGTKAEYFGSNPTREPDIDYVYDFVGWQPELGPVTYDVTYTATYTKNPRQYTIIFQNEGGVEIERQFLTHNEMPVCKNTPTKAGHYLEWQPTISAVTGDAVYTAHWLEEKPTHYQVTFVDYDGQTILQTEEVEAGTLPTYRKALPQNKPATNEYTYVFDHWSPEISAVTENITYTAVYRERPKMYEIIFYDENGNEIENSLYPYGAMPECDNAPIKSNTAEYSYTLVWNPQIQTVIESTSYTATYVATKNQYAVQLQSANDTVCTFVGAGIYEYGTPISISAQVKNERYEFIGWQEDHTLAQSFDTIVRGTIRLTAMVQKKSLEDLVVANNTTYTVDSFDEIKDLYIYSDGITSSQLLGTDSLKLWGDAYFELTQSFEANKWYAIAVPWPVEAEYGVLDNTNSRLQFGVDFDIKYYDGSVRANRKTHEESWRYIYAVTDKTIYPGHAYLISFADQRTGVRFRKKPRAELLTNNVVPQAHPSSNNVYANWEGISNSSLQYSYLASNAIIAQNYNPGLDDYMPFELQNTRMIVGQSAFVQESESNVLPTDIHRYTVTLAKDGVLLDRVYLQTTDSKSAPYIIGQDVEKIGRSTNKAQMWISDDDAELCMSTKPFEATQVDFPLSFNVPTDGGYTVYLESGMIESMSLILMRGDDELWDLSRGSTVVQITHAGISSNYRLRVQPKQPTSISCEEAESNAIRTQKILIDGHIYILRGEQMYNLQGIRVK